MLFNKLFATSCIISLVSASSNGLYARSYFSNDTDDSLTTGTTTSTISVTYTLVSSSSSDSVATSDLYVSTADSEKEVQLQSPATVTVTDAGVTTTVTQCGATTAATDDSTVYLTSVVTQTIPITADITVTDSVGSVLTVIPTTTDVVQTKTATLTLTISASTTSESETTVTRTTTTTSHLDSMATTISTQYYFGNGTVGTTSVAVEQASSINIVAPTTTALYAYASASGITSINGTEPLTSSTSTSSLARRFWFFNLL